MLFSEDCPRNRREGRLWGHLCFQGQALIAKCWMQTYLPTCQPGPISHTGFGTSRGRVSTYRPDSASYTESCG